MRTSRAIVWLVLLIAVLALMAAGAGLFWPGEEGPLTSRTLRGETVEIYGRGLYRYDSLLSGAGYRGQDAVTLLLGVLLLIVSLVRYRRGSLKGRLLLTGTLAYFLYVYATMAVNAAYNDLFLVYVALFSASFYAFVLVFTSIDLRAFNGGMWRWIA